MQKEKQQSMMMEPEFDEDDLINDYVEDEDYEMQQQPPPPRPSAAAASTAVGGYDDGYDESFLEEMMMAHGNSNEQQTQITQQEQIRDISTTAPATTAAPLPSSRENESDPFAATFTQQGQQQQEGSSRSAADVRAAFEQARKQNGSRTAEDPFSFDRYDPNSDWRQNQGKSAADIDTMLAKSWKPANSSSTTGDGGDGTTTQSLSLGISAASNRRHAPDVELLNYLEQRTRPSHQKRRPAGQMASRPKPGVQNVAMTLGNGEKLYFSVTKEENMFASTTASNEQTLGTASVSASSPQNNNRHQTSPSRYALGVSMEDLMRRVNATRRKKEHERQLRLRREMSRLEKCLDGYEVDVENQTNDDDNDDDDDSLPELQEEKDNRLWVDKHAPVNFTHLLSDERTNREVVRALRAWDPYVFKREPPPRVDFGYKNDMTNNNNNNDKNEKYNKHGGRGGEGADKDSKKSTTDRRPDENNRILLLSGTPGVGKTTLAHIIARHAGYRPIEVNASDDRSESVLVDRVVRAMESKTLNITKGDEEEAGKPNCLILDEIDGVEARTVKALVDIIRADVPSKGQKGPSKTPHLRRPIIFICNNKYAPALRPLLPYARQFNVYAPSPSRLVARLRAVLAAEQLSISGGSALLNDLVNTSGGDIRSCLYTLQFATARAKQLAAQKRRAEAGSSRLMVQDKILVDIAPALKGVIGSDGMKDKRNDVAETVTGIFKKEKERRVPGSSSILKDSRSSVDRVIDSVQAFGDNARILDFLFINVPRVSYIDPTLDRCSAAHEWLSDFDLFRVSSSNSENAATYTMESLYIPSAAAAIHLMCRVEQKPDLLFTSRDMYDARQQHELNQALTQKFAEGLSMRFRGSRCVSMIVQETIPYALWALSAGEGNGALNRAASSTELLKPSEQIAFHHHVSVLQSLGLTYTLSQNPTEGRRDYGNPTSVLALDPPIDRLAQYTGLNLLENQIKYEVPPPLKELLALRCAHVKLNLMSETNAEVTSASVQQKSQKKPIESKKSQEKPRIPDTSSEVVMKDEKVDTSPAFKQSSPSKRKPIVATSQNFLGEAAKKAKLARNTRCAARVSFRRAKTDKTTHTGSGVPLSQAIRLKYIKGFTEAVRTPCIMDDLY